MREFQPPKMQLTCYYGWDFANLVITKSDYRISFERIGPSPKIESFEERKEIITAEFVPPYGSFHWTIFSVSKHLIIAQGTAGNLQEALDNAKQEFNRIEKKARVEMIKLVMPSTIAEAILKGRTKKQIWEKLFDPENENALYKGLFNRKEFETQYKQAKDHLNHPIPTTT